MEIIAFALVCFVLLRWAFRKAEQEEAREIRRRMGRTS